MFQVTIYQQLDGEKDHLISWTPNSTQLDLQITHSSVLRMLESAMQGTIHVMFEISMVQKKIWQSWKLYVSVYSIDYVFVTVSFGKV